jgi:hypothetical protein
MSAAATQFQRMVDALAIGDLLAPEDAAALRNALVLARTNNISIEIGLRWPSRWRDEVRKREALY